MNVSTQYEISAPDIVAEDFDGDVVILNLAEGRYFSLAGISTTIWTLLLDGHTPAAILDSVGQKRADLIDSSRAFLERLVELTLVRQREGQFTATMPPIEEGWIGDTPQIDIYDDLAELIFADPIHDVDEQTGWPVPRQQ